MVSLPFSDAQIDALKRLANDEIERHGREGELEKAIARLARARKELWEAEMEYDQREREVSR